MMLPIDRPVHTAAADAPVDGAADVVTLGETMVLFWPSDGGGLETATSYQRSFGGAESNFSIALARLGHRPRWISRLGDDPFGRYMRMTLQREGVLVEAAVDPHAPTAVFFKERVARGRSVHYYRRGSAASRLSPDDLHPAQFAGARVLHLTGITPALSASCATAVERAVALGRAAGALVCVDPNVRPQLFESPDECRRTILRLIAGADIVLLGHEDAEVLYPRCDEDAVLAAVRDAGVTTAVLKRGERGAMALHEGTRYAVDAYSIEVVDTVGAGDGFDAGFIAGLLRGLSLPEALALGARVGAAAVGHAGDWEGYLTAAALGLARR